MNPSDRICAKQAKGACVIPFRGLRYNQSKIPDLSQVVSPPYDIISPDEQTEYHERHPFNAIHIDYGVDLPGDDVSRNRYTRAAALLGRWIEEGVLVPDAGPSLYLLREEFTGPGKEPAVREGFIAAVRLAEFSEGVILPHEETSSGPKEDRLRLMEATEANLSPIFCLYSDPAQRISAALEDAAPQKPDVSITDDAGTRHSLWVVEDSAATAEVTELLSRGKLLIADGHHRYETALAYRDARRRRDDPGQEEQPYDYLMVYLSNMDDSSPSILPIHRLVSGLSAETVANIDSLLGEDFEITEVDSATPAQAMIEAIGSSAPDRNTFGVLLPASGRYLTAAGRRPKPMLDAGRNGKSAAWRSLDVSVLDRLVLGKLLGIAPGGLNAGARVTFAERTENALEEAGRHDAAFFLNPTSMADIKAVAETGEKMPQKSTYFYPKPLTGLVFRSFRF